MKRAFIVPTADAIAALAGLGASQGDVSVGGFVETAIGTVESLHLQTSTGASAAMSHKSHSSHQSHHSHASHHSSHR